MKNTVKLFAALAASLLAFSCTPDFPSPDQGAVPSIDKITPAITVDQETNYVTFAIQEKGLVPMWIFGEDKIDGKTNKKYSYTGNGITLRIREAGTHQVEVKVMNSNGVSQGSKICEYTLENTYRDPFDPTSTLKKLANTWVWNADEAGHMGCGEPGTDGLNWWSAGPHDKDGVSLYDDQMIFSVDGMYTYDPVDGQTYVNKDSGFRADLNPNDGNDYVVPIEGYTHPFSVEQTFNDAGIEELWVVLQEGDNLSYIPNPEALTNPSYKILSLSSKKVDFVVDNGGISWHYQFVPYVHKAGPEELLAGTEASGKAWVMDSATPGHLGCGPDGSNPAGWWSAGPEEKAAFGLYDDVLTFFPDGKYVFNPGPDGKIYVNKDVTDLLGSPASEDVDIDFEEQTATYTFDGEVIEFPAGTVIGYVPNNAFLSDARFYVTEISETTLKGYTITDGIAWQYIFRARDIKAPEASIGGVAFAGGKAAIEVSNGDELEVKGIDLASYWIDPDFFQAISATTLKFVGHSGEYEIMNISGDKPWLKAIPMKNGSAANWDSDKMIWIIGEGAGKPEGGQPGWSTGAAADLPFAKTGDNTYQITLYCSTNTNVKVFGQADWGKEWLTANYASISGGILETTADDGNLHSCAGMEAGWYTLKITDTDGEGLFALTVEAAAEVEKPFILGEPLDLSDLNAAFLAGSWTWESTTVGHMGCGGSIENPTEWWCAQPGDKAACHVYDDVMTFTADGKYTYDPVDGQTYMNTGVTKMDAAKDHQEGGDDWVVNVSKQENIDYELDGAMITFPANTIFSYIPNDAYLDSPELYVTAIWENQMEISVGPSTAGIFWRIRLKRI